MNFAAGHSLLRAAPAARARRDYSRARNPLERRGAHEFGARSKGSRCIRWPSLSDSLPPQAGPFLPRRSRSVTAAVCATPRFRAGLSIAACSAPLCPRGGASQLVCRVYEARKTRRCFCTSSMTFQAAKPTDCHASVSRSSVPMMAANHMGAGHCVTLLGTKL